MNPVRLREMMSTRSPGLIDHAIKIAGHNEGRVLHSCPAESRRLRQNRNLTGAFAVHTAPSPP